MSASAPELEAMIGRTLGGKYRLVRLLGRGGMGCVFEAENVAIGKRFAVKLLDREWSKDPDVAGRFAREARAASAVESEHIVSVVDAGTDEACPYIAMELLRGEDLGTRLRRESRVPQREALHVAAQVLRGLAAAHAAGIVHRDLKPDNVLLVDHAGDPNFAKIVDFGISKIEKPHGGTAPLALTRRGVILGTPLYMSPEQARSLSDVDGRADLYSVGAILFECLAGRPPHVGESYEQILLSLCMQDAPDVRVYAPDVPEEVAAFVARALARERAERFSSAAEMLSALRALAPADPAARPLPAEAMQALGAAPVSAVHPTEAAWTAPELDAHQRARRARARAAVTAVVATLAGAVATIGVLAMHKGPGTDATEAPSARAASVATRTQSSATAPPPASPTPGLSPTPAPSPASSPTRAPSPTAPRPLAPTAAHPLAPPSSAHPPAAPRTPSPPRPSGLDIQRDLP
jgi:serine/threonine-protein kinase